MVTAQPKETVASKFKNYFVNVAKHLLKDIADLNKKLQDFLNNANKHSFFINEADLIEVSDLLDKINVTKATDRYGISPKLVKMAARKIKKSSHLPLFNRARDIF